MLRLIFIRFWWVWLPLVVWLVWYLGWGRKKKRKNALKKWEEKLWLYSVLASGVLLVITIIVFGLTQEQTKGEYSPAQYKDGQLIPGSIVPEQGAASGEGQ